MRNEFDWVKEIQDFSSKLKSYFDEFERPANTTSGFSPASDVYVVGDVCYVEIELPGGRKEDVRITMSGSNLEVSGEKRSARPDGAQTIVSGRRFGAFSKRIALPADLDVNLGDSSATFENGILRIALKKKQASDAGASIPIV